MNWKLIERVMSGSAKCNGTGARADFRAAHLDFLSQEKRIFLEPPSERKRRLD